MNACNAEHQQLVARLQAAADQLSPSEREVNRLETLCRQRQRATLANTTTPVFPKAPAITEADIPY